MYRKLDSKRIIDTAERLQRRIRERFPESSLSRVADELTSVGHETAALSEWLARPNHWVRTLVQVCVILVVVVVIGVLWSVDWRMTFFSSLSDLLQGLESAINDFVFLAVAIFFLARWEVRMKRRRALKALHELRAMAHIIDMHQLPKDPEQTGRGVVFTPSSPARTLTPYELTRYLNYCSELLSIISKVAAVYVQHFDDPVTLSAVNDLENLTTGLARKIWQKIMILDRILRSNRTGA